MHIKKVKEHSASYCELVVTDNLKDVICICDPFPFNNEIIPLNGMEVIMLNAFFLDKTPRITLINDIKKQDYKLIKASIFGMGYAIKGKIVDEKKYIVKAYDFYISLEYLFSSEYDGFQKFPYKEGEWIEFVADRFDAVI